MLTAKKLRLIFVELLKYVIKCFLLAYCRKHRYVMF